MNPKQAALAMVPKLLEHLEKEALEGNMQAMRLIFEVAGIAKSAVGRPSTRRTEEVPTAKQAAALKTEFAEILADGNDDG